MDIEGSESVEGGEGGERVEPEQLTDGDWDDGDPAWSPDGTRIAFTSNRREDRWRFFNPDVYTLSVKDGKAGELQQLTDGSLACSSPSWSPDGKTIAFLAKLKVRSGNHADLYTIAVDIRRGASRCLTSEFEGSCSDCTNSDTTGEHF